MDTITKLISELTDEDTMVGEAGGESMVYDAFPSSSNPGLWMITTEHGHLFMAPTDEVQVKKQ